MMRKRKEIKRERIIFYYILAIALPCLILGVLAFRGIKNDQALVEREQRGKMAEVSLDIIQQTDEYLSTIEESLRVENDSIEIPQKIIFIDSLIIRFIARHPVIAGILLISDNDVKKLLYINLLYVPDKSLSGFNKNGFQTMQRILDIGWQYEFNERNNNKALKYYESVHPDILEEQSRGEVLNAIARVQKKLALDDDAIESYEMIYSKYSMVYIQNRIPLGAIALLEKSQLYLKKSDSVSALKNIQLLLNQIQSSTWEIEFSNYSLFLSKADEMISLCENSNKEEIKQLLQKIYTIKDNIFKSEENTKYILSFFSSTELSSVDNDPLNKNQRHKTRINGDLYFWSLIEASNHWKRVLLIDRDYLLKNIIHPLVIENANEAKFSWEVTDENGELLMKSDNIPGGKIPVITAFPSYLPSYELLFYPENSGLFLSLLYSREGLFFYIFIVIIIILAFGLYFTLRTINNEIHFSKMKSNFMSTVSHEFKSPLTSIRQMAEMLEHGRVPSTDRKKKYYTMILKQSERLTHLIENILDFSKMEEDQKIFRFEKDNIVTTVTDAVVSFQNNMVDQDFKINLSYGDSIPDIVFDKEAMEQVMHNLLDNACKYSGNSKKIKVEIETKGKAVIIKVTDFGVGINNKDKDKIFDRFYRAGDELTQSVKGSGIGLTIVKQIMIAHKGDIFVQSEPGKGSTFSIILPMA